MATSNHPTPFAADDLTVRIVLETARKALADYKASDPGTRTDFEAAEHLGALSYSLGRVLDVIGEQAGS